MARTQVNKEQWKNLWRQYRWGMRRFTRNETLGWISVYSHADAMLLKVLTEN